MTSLGVVRLQSLDVVDTSHHQLTLLGLVVQELFGDFILQDGGGTRGGFHDDLRFYFEEMF